MYCKKCGQRLDKDALFCFHCGAVQELIEEPAPAAEPEKEYCTQCGAELRKGAAFCVRCGAGREQPTELLPDPPAAEAIPEKAFCIQCGAELEEGAAFCLMCGARQDGEAPVIAPTPKEEQPVLSSESAAKKKGRILAIVLPVFLLAVAMGALMTLRPWEAKEAAAPELEASAKMLAEEGEAPLQEAAPTEAPQEAKPTPEQPDIGTALTVTPMPALAAAFAPIPIPEGEYAIFNRAGDRQLSPSIVDGTLCMADPTVSVGDGTFRISLADGKFANSYHISGSFGRIKFKPGESPALVSGTQEGQEAQWLFSSADNGMYFLHLAQAPGYALTYGTGLPAFVPFDPADPQQQWIITAPLPKATPASEPEGDAMSQYIYGLASRDMDISELSGLDEETVGYIRNGIFALGGKIFKTQKYREYFGAQSWYTPYSEDDDLVTARFNGHMKHNLNVCIEYEDLMGWR